MLNYLKKARNNIRKSRVFNAKKLKLELFGRGFLWLDTGTHDSLIEAGRFTESIEKTQGLKVACLEEISYRMNYINSNKLKKIAEGLNNSEYGKYLMRLIRD